jgi:hypothetical protein
MFMTKTILLTINNAVVKRRDWDMELKIIEHGHFLKSK